MKHMLLRSSLLIITLLPLQLFAQGTLVSTTFELTINSFDAEEISLSTTGIGSGDQLFSLAFYYRVTGDTQEFQIGGTPDVQSVYGFGNLFLDWNDVDNRGLFSARLEILLSENADVQNVNYVLSIFPIDSFEGPMDLFFYLDPDLDDSSDGDSGELVEAEINFIRVSDGDTCVLTTAVVGFDGVDAFQVTEHSDILDSLADDALTDLDDSGLPFGPGNFTVAFQVSDLPASTAAILGVTTFPTTEEGCSSAQPPPPPQSQAVPVPSTGKLPLTILVMLMMLGAWRFRSRFF